MILVIRGHIRSSFDNNNFYNLVKEIYSFNTDLQIYIHTWNIIQNNLSWRKMEMKEIAVTEETIYSYFKDLKHLIKHIIIDDDTKIQLIGDLNGLLGRSNIPKRGWKNYWYGKYQIINYLKNILVNNDEIIINTRFDLLQNSNSFTNKLIMDFINNNKSLKFNKNKFIYNNARLGIDNIYIGNINTMYTLIYHFNNNLDNIKIGKHPELSVFDENNKLF